MIFFTYYLIKFIFNSSYWIITTTGNGIYKLIKKHNDINENKHNLILDKETDNNTLNTIDPIKLNLLKEEIKKELKQEIEINTLQK